MIQRRRGIGLVVACACAAAYLLPTQTYARADDPARLAPSARTVTDSIPGLCAGPGAGETGSALTGQEVQDVVNYHDKVRKEVGVGSVKWSTDVAKVAQEWADHLAETGELEHRAAPRKYGENIAFDSTVLKGCQAWYTEIKRYKTGTPFNPEDQAGHYTQMVWRNSTEIGIGKAVIKKGPFKGMLAIVANYNPPGNYVGEKPY